MAVIQRFTIELPTDPFHDESDGWLLILSREGTERLCADLHEALGTAPAGLADDLYRIEQKIDDLPGYLSGGQDMDEGALNISDPEVDTLTGDEVLARLQAMAAGPPGTSPSWAARSGMSPQSGIGNLPA